MSIIHPAHRFATWRHMRSLPFGDERTRLRNATYYESFPASYTTEQVLSAVTLMIALYDHGVDSAEYKSALENVR